ncbi:MAG: BCCT family transporter [Fusobacteriaceae bacterium]
MKKKYNNTVFYVSIIISIIIVFWALLLPWNFKKVADWLFSVISKDFGWIYVFSMAIFVFFSLWLAYFSRFKNIKLGKNNEKPEYSIFSWFSMLFSAGMGVGLIFWGVAEPISYYLEPLNAISGTKNAAVFAFNKSFLHWGLHPWAAYSVIGLSLGYMQFRKEKKGLMSSLLAPLFGNNFGSNIYGKSIDIITVIATVAGIATSLGLGTYQINSGLSYIFGIPNSIKTQIIIVSITTIIVIISVSTPLEKGIKLISNSNIYFSVILLLFCFIFGPTVEIINTFIDGIGIYISNFITNTFSIGAFGENSWYGSWTLFYWAWFIAWAPFTGMFIARISRGRTIKEFITGVLIAPTLVSFVWFSIFGRIGINSSDEILKKAFNSIPTAYFIVMEQFSWGTTVSIFTIILLFTFFITSANSATFVLGILSSDGDLNPSNSKKIIWALLQSTFALALMIGSENGLQMLQIASITLALPFAIIMILCIVSFMKELKKEI